MFNKSFAAFLFWSAICSIAASQVVKVSKGPPETVVEKLRQHGVSSDEPSLLGALSSPDHEIRALAAVQLAAQKAQDALPSLLSALAAEKESDAKADMALAVAQLGDKTGLSDLKETCNDAATGAPHRLRAARYVQDLGHDSCYKAVEEMVVSAPDPDSRNQALFLLTSADNLRRHDVRMIRRIVVAALRDHAMNVRLTASSSLARIGDRSDVLFLRQAIAAEHNPDARSSMEADLKTLLKDTAAD